MDQLKKLLKEHQGLVILVLVALIIASVATRGDRRKFSLSDFGTMPLLKSDCSSLKNAVNSSSVSISFNASDVAVMRDKIKVLITKYNGQITSDSFNSYPTGVGYATEDNATINLILPSSQNEFLTELADLVKSSGGVNTGYNYTDNSLPEYNYGYSSYSTCINMMQTVSTDILQLKLFTEAIRDERDMEKISLLSQLLSNGKMTLQNDISAVNSLFTVSEKPSINISINTLQK